MANGFFGYYVLDNSYDFAWFGGGTRPARFILERTERPLAFINMSTAAGFPTVKRLLGQLRVPG